MIANLLLLFPLFYPVAGKTYHYTVQQVEHLFNILIYNRHQKLVKILLDEDKRSEFKQILQSYAREQTTQAPGLMTFLRHLMKADKPGMNLAQLYLSFSDTNYDDELEQLQKSPLKQTTIYDEGPYSQSDKHWDIGIISKAIANIPESNIKQQLFDIMPLLCRRHNIGTIQDAKYYDSDPEITMTDEMR